MDADTHVGASRAAMLYGTVGPALLATLKADQFQSTLDGAIVRKHTRLSRRAPVN